MEEIFKDLKNYIEKYYKELGNSKKPIAYLSAMAPQEILRALDFEIFLPENHSAFIGAKRIGEKFIKRTIQEGFSPEICTYLLADIGSHLEKKPAFEIYGLREFPKPEIFCYSTNQCYEIGEWFKYLGSFYKVPVFEIPAIKPFSNQRDYIKFYEKKLKNLVQNLEKICNKKLDLEMLKEKIKNSKNASLYWEKILDLNLKKNYKISFLDHLFLMAPMVLGRGKEETVEFYKRIYEKAKKLKEKEYKFRIWWEGMPLWGKLRYLKEKFEELKIAPIGSTYCASWVFNFEGKDPFKAMARAYYSNLFITWAKEKKLKWLCEKAKKYKVDGFIFLEAKTCKQNTNTCFGLPKKIFEEIGVPFTVIYGDMVDLRHFSEAETNLKLEGFLETVKSFSRN